jgi:hypothetical protein
MRAHLDDPLIVFAIALIAQSIAVYVGDFLRKRAQQLREDERHDFDTIRATTMTLHALIIGFTFSMAVGYGERRSYPRASANLLAASQSSRPKAETRGL